MHPSKISLTRLLSAPSFFDAIMGRVLKGLRGTLSTGLRDEATSVVDALVTIGKVGRHRTAHALFVVRATIKQLLKNSLPHPNDNIIH